MQDNPYESPRVRLGIRPSRKALLGLSALSLLSVPASAIAGSTVCTDLVVLHRNVPLGMMLGIPCCLAIVAGALAVEEKAKSDVGWQEIKRALSAVAYFQVVALPIALAIGFCGGAIGYIFLALGNGENEWLIFWVIGSAVNLAWSCTAYYAWRSWFQEKAKKESELQP